MNDALFQHGDVGAKGLAAADKQALIDITNAADTNNDIIKTDVVAKINAALGTALTNAATWTAIRAAIVKDADKVTGNIKAGVNIDGVQGKTEVVDTTTALGATAAEIVTGKETFVNGAKVTGTGTKAKAYDSGSGNSSAAVNYTDAVTGTNVSKNSAVVSGLNFPNGIGAIFIKSGDQLNTHYKFNSVFANTNGNISTDNNKWYRVDGVNAYVTNTGFRLPVDVSGAFTWEAWGR